MLSLSINVGDTLNIGDHGRIRFDEKSGRRVKLAIDLPGIRVWVGAMGMRPANYVTGLGREAREPALERA